MECLLASFGGAFLGSALVLLLFIKMGTKEENAEPEEKQEKKLERKIPKNIGMFADPLERYNKYRDDESGLYAPIKQEGVNRLGKD